MSTDGTCPTCQRVLEAPQIASTVPTHRKVTAENINLRQLANGLDDDDDAKAPWHFKLLVVALCGYLGWRVIQIFV
jgi:hypothetical protein